MLTFLTGFIASMAHVVTGPDHLAAVSPLAIDSRKKSWIIGLAWGLGHTLGMLLIGLLFVLFKEFLPIDAIAKYSETVIGFLLIGIGIWALVRIYLRHSHGNRPHGHFHDKPFLYAHIHKHTHEPKPVHEHHHPHAPATEHKHSHVHPHPHGHGHEHELQPAPKVGRNAITALSIGVIHGFAGFSHLFALLPSLALPTVMASVIYITAFAAGTIVTMIIFSFIMGMVAFQSFVRNKQLFLKWFTFAGAMLAIAIGILWLVHPF